MYKVTGVMISEEELKAKVEELGKQIEKDLYNEALNLVIKAHPTWELEGYILVDTSSN
jgi:hypothetical protein